MEVTTVISDEHFTFTCPLGSIIVRIKSEDSKPIPYPKLLCMRSQK